MGLMLVGAALFFLGFVLGMLFIVLVAASRRGGDYG